MLPGKWYARWTYFGKATCMSRPWRRQKVADRGIEEIVQLDAHVMTWITGNSPTRRTERRGKNGPSYGLQNSRYQRAEKLAMYIILFGRVRGAVPTRIVHTCTVLHFFSCSCSHIQGSGSSTNGSSVVFPFRPRSRSKARNSSRRGYRK